MLNGAMRGRTAESLVGLRQLMGRLRAGRMRKAIVVLALGPCGVLIFGSGAARRAGARRRLRLFKPKR